MPKYKFVYEPRPPVSDAFHERWHGCTNIYCKANIEYLYHYHEDGVLHIWIDRVLIKSIRKYFFKKPVVLHSDYTLEHLSQFIDWADQIEEV